MGTRCLSTIPLSTAQRGIHPPLLHCSTYVTCTSPSAPATGLAAQHRLRFRDTTCVRSRGVTRSVPVSCLTADCGTNRAKQHSLRSAALNLHTPPLTQSRGEIIPFIFELVTPTLMSNSPSSPRSMMKRLSLRSVES